MEQTLTRPVDYDTWSISAQLAYDAVMLRALQAEKSLDNIQNQLHASPSKVYTPSDTLTWQTLMLRTMNDVFQEAATSLDPQQIFETVTRTIAQLLEATSVYVCDWNTKTKTCTVFAQHISEKANAAERDAHVGEIHQLDSLFERKLQEETWVAHAHNLDLSPSERAEFLENGLKTALYVPMRAKDELIGFIEIWDTRQERDFHARQIEFVTSVVSQIAGSVRMAQLHRALQESDSRFRLLVNTMRGGLVQVDRNGTIVFTNERFAEMLELQAEMLIGENLEILWEQMADHNRLDEARIVRSNGEIVWVQVSRSEIRSERGQVLGAVYVYTDISKRKEAEQHALELGIEKERVHLLSQFVEDASHEFYTPLSVMKTQLYLLEKYLPEDNRAKEKLFSLNQQSNVIQDLVQALVLMSKLDSTRGLSMRPYKLNALIEQVTDELRSSIENKQQHLYVEMRREDLIVDCDAEKLRLAIKEILDNAHRYTAEGGNIILRLFRRDEQAIVEIRDTGLGMNEEVQSHIFERFYRADKARSTRGFGLGLSIAKRIIDLHEGEISVQSQPQLGSTFRIILVAGEES